ncbi:hypothetical protein [Bacillus sp. FSL R12-0074]|uniref:hypothetical protein n=1 Tax=Bacillus sp. FSL R12-0074 TaxID=2954664 RepID=UPI0030FAE28E
MIGKLTFGYKELTVQYVLRPSCYSVIFNNTCSKIAIIEKEDTYYLNDGFFYIAQKIHEVEVHEEDHILQWMSPSLAIEHLLHDHQKWAVEQALLLRNKK